MNKFEMAGLAGRALGNNCINDVRMYNLIVDRFETDCICYGISQEARELYKQSKTIFSDFLPVNLDEIPKDSPLRELYLQFMEIG
jgi:hypothetical protein